MIIADLDNLEVIAQTQEIEGGMIFSLESLAFQSISSFNFDSLVSGATGAFGGGEANVLTTAFPNNFNVGFSFTYASQALGLPL
ncbi:hypothetical protein [Cyanothece sp. BG0011]|uniref:hypothetical protein n=1 Tax=Cyanothece sp. BG0011 TaxID=2082950 RepID=UPI000D1F8FBE|nr:hypothetical protein [Cyanothece sp. BG0011]